MLVRHFMAREVVTLSPDQSCLDGYRALHARKIRRAPVTVGGRVVGMVSERDLLKLLPGTIGQAATPAGERSLAASVRTVMATSVLSVEPNDHLEVAARRMLKHNVGGLPVIDDGRLVGILTESDIFRALWTILSTSGGTRIALEERVDGIASGAPIDFGALCVEHGCRILMLLRYPQQDGTASTYLSIETQPGRLVDPLIEAIWNRGDRVISVDRLS